MKKMLFSFIISLAATGSVFGLPQRIYSLKAKFPQALASLSPSLPVYYKGHKIDLTKGWTKLPECSEPCTFSLLITENVDFVAKGNNVRYLKRIPDQEYTWYDLTLTLEQEAKDTELVTPMPAQKTYRWNIERHDEAATPERIPEHTIVLLTNPAFVEKLKTETALPGAIDIVLPTVVFKETVDPETFKEKSEEILLGPVMDLDAIHRKDSPSCMTRKDTVVISATKQNYDAR